MKTQKCTQVTPVLLFAQLQLHTKIKVPGGEERQQGCPFRRGNVVKFLH